MVFHRIFFLSLLLTLLAAGGCRLFSKDAPLPSDASLLTPLTSTGSQVEFEVAFVKLPSGNSSLADELWQQVDEQSLPAEVRRESQRNGFRAGVLGSNLPRDLQRLLHTDASPANDPPAADATDQTAAAPQGIDVSKEPKLTVHQLFLEPGTSGEIAAGDVRPEMQLLYTENGAARGRSFQEAQPQFAAELFTLRDGRVELRLLPEIHFGQFKKQYRSGDGMFRLETTRDKVSFDTMTLRCPLQPGEMLVLGQDVDRPGSLGHHFFTELRGGRPERQLLLIRRRSARHDARFLPGATAVEADIPHS